MTWNPQHIFQALALTGGGYRGLFTAKALQILEEHANRPIGRCFDLVCGTSIGGVVALAVAFEIPMSKVVDIFESNGEVIFPPRQLPKNKIQKALDFWEHRRTARYSASALREVITQLIPADATLGDAIHPLAIPAVNLTEGKPQVFKTRHKEQWHRDSKIKAVNIAMATSAAPTFFELAEVGGCLYADGGIFANAPDLIALHEAEHFIGASIDMVRILSIGTTKGSYSLSFSAGRNLGIADWMEEERLFQITISAQQQFVDQLIAHRLGSRYVRIDREPSASQTRDLGLDIASKVASKTLTSLASKAVTDIIGTTLVPFINHSPALKPIRDDNEPPTPPTAESPVQTLPGAGRLE